MRRRTGSDEGDDARQRAHPRPTLLCRWRPEYRRTGPRVRQAQRGTRERDALPLGRHRLRHRLPSKRRQVARAGRPGSGISRLASRNDLGSTRTARHSSHLVLVLYGRKYWGALRATFVIGPDGVVAHVIARVTPRTHDDEVLAVLEQLAAA